MWVVLGGKPQKPLRTGALIDVLLPDSCQKVYNDKLPPERKSWPRSVRPTRGGLLFLRRGGTADFLDGCVRRWRGGERPGYEEVVVVEIAVHASGNLGGLGAVGGTSAAQEDYRHDASDVGLGVGGEPSEAGAGV